MITALLAPIGLISATGASVANAGGIHYWQALLLGVIQGVSELFPISSLGHTVVIPALFGWHNVVAAQSKSESFWLAFLVGLHVGTAIALAIFYRRDWIAIVRGVVHSAIRREIRSADERIGWLLILATIPAGIMGLIFEHKLRTLFAKPLAASAFLVVNGLILMFGELVRRRADVKAQRDLRRSARRQRAAAVEALRASQPAPPPLAAPRPVRELATLEFKEALVVGFAQVLALFAGISRSGVTIVAGLLRGLDHEDAARFSFLLATPVILLAGVYKLHDFLGPNGNGVRGQTILASICAGVAAWFSVRFLSKWFTTRTVLPFAGYCLVAGTLLLIRFA